MHQQLVKLMERLGVAMGDAGLYQEAVTHASYVHEHPELGVVSNQRLEFLGDAVLGLAVSTRLFEQFGDWSEGRLTRARAGLVCTPTLARVARTLGLGEALLLGRGEEGAGGRERANNLADAFEALVGAVYLDLGPAAAGEFVWRCLDGELEGFLQGAHDGDYKSSLQEKMQRESDAEPEYRILTEQGPDHDKLFTVGVYQAGRLLGQGVGRSKKEAAQEAARKALESLPGS